MPPFGYECSSLPGNIVSQASRGTPRKAIHPPGCPKCGATSSLLSRKHSCMVVSPPRAQVEWHKGSALEPETYEHLLPDVTAVVHTIGTLFEKSGYKSALKDGNVPRFVSSIAADISGCRVFANPLERERKKREGSYEVLNRDTGECFVRHRTKARHLMLSLSSYPHPGCLNLALRVCETFLKATPTVETIGPRAFIYVSAEDCNRPLVPSGYIETKREAEILIEKMVQDHSGCRSVYIRPCASLLLSRNGYQAYPILIALIYHPHFRPIISPLAALLDLSATIHAKLPSAFPTPSAMLRALGSVVPTPSSARESLVDSPFSSMARVLTIPPIHVDHVAEAICIAADNSRADVRGAYGLEAMRALIGYYQKGQQHAGAHA